MASRALRGWLLCQSVCEAKIGEVGEASSRGKRMGILRCCVGVGVLCFVLLLPLGRYVWHCVFVSMLEKEAIMVYVIIALDESLHQLVLYVHVPII